MACWCVLLPTATCQRRYPLISCFANREEPSDALIPPAYLSGKRYMWTKCTRWNVKQSDVLQSIKPFFFSDSFNPPCLVAR